MTAAEFVSGKKTILFDLFHTLTVVESTWPGGKMTAEILGVSKEAWNEQLLEKSPDRLKGKIKDPYEIIGDMARAINPGIQNDLIDKAVKNRLARFEGAVVNIPENTISTLEKLKSMHKKTGLISNADVTEVYAWPRSPIKDYFDITVFSCEVGLVKPDREIYQYALNKLNEKPENAIFVGDGGSNELVGAKQAGISTIMITGIIKEIWPDKIEARKAFADYVIESIDELV